MRIVSYNQVPLPRSTIHSKLIVSRLRWPYWLDLFWMLFYLMLLLGVFLVGNAWGRQAGHPTSDAYPVGMTVLLAVANAHIIVPSLIGGLLKKTSVFDREAQGFFVNGVLVSSLSDIANVEVQGRRETTGVSHNRVVVTLTGGKTIVIAETRRIESLLYYMSSAYNVTRIEKSRLSGSWNRIDQGCPFVNARCGEMFSLEKAIKEFITNDTQIGGHGDLPVIPIGKAERN